MTAILKLYNTYLAPASDELLDLGAVGYNWKDLFVSQTAYLGSITMNGLIEMSDNAIQSITYLYGKTNNLLIDMHTDGRMIIQALGTGTPFSTPDLSFVGTSYFIEDMGFLTSTKIMFRATSNYINSDSVDHLDFFATTSIDLNANMDISGKNIITDTSIGTIIGTSITQKLGFFNATPIIQPINTTDIKDTLIALGLLASGGATNLDLDGGTGIFGGTMTLSTGSIVDSSGSISFGNENLTTTGKLSAHGYYLNQITVDEDTTLTENDDVILVDCSLIPITITLPIASSVSGKLYIIKSLDLGSAGCIVTIDGESGETIDNGSTYPITNDYTTVRLISNGLSWYTI